MKFPASIYFADCCGIYERNDVMVEVAHISEGMPAGLLSLALSGRYPASKRVSHSITSSMIAHGLMNGVGQSIAFYTRQREILLYSGCGWGKGPMIRIKPITRQDAQDIATWRYARPYAMYSFTNEVLPILMDSKRRYFSVFDEEGQLWGFCCFGREARVPGGSYRHQEPEVLDVGVGMRPEKVGKGQGTRFVAAILTFAHEQFRPRRLRVSIAAFNARSQKMFANLGFKEISRFRRKSDGMEFIQLER
ncbi:MAG: GNAT family N-acetyltransferase [Anaerolineales bacterium]